MTAAATLLAAWGSVAPAPCPACVAALEAWAATAAAALGVGEVPAGGVRLGLTRRLSLDAQLQWASTARGAALGGAWVLREGASPWAGLAGVGGIDLLAAGGASGRGGRDAAVGVRLHLARESFLAPGLAVALLGRWQSDRGAEGRGTLAEGVLRVEAQRTWRGWTLGLMVGGGRGDGRWRAGDTLAVRLRPRSREAAVAVSAPPWRFLRAWGQAGARAQEAEGKRAAVPWLALGLRLAL